VRSRILTLEGAVVVGGLSHHSCRPVQHGRALLESSLARKKMEHPLKVTISAPEVLGESSRRVFLDTKTKMLEETNGKHPGGRPSKRTLKLTKQICEAISYGLTDEETAALVGIDDSTFTRWKKDPEFCRAIKKAQATRLLIRLKRIEKGESGWQGTAWALERQDPERFGSPEARLRRKDEDDPKKTAWEVAQYLATQQSRIQELTCG
jgi:hypothetical protein